MPAPVDNPVAEQLVRAARDLADEVDRLSFAPPVAYVYNPLRHAWPLHEQYLRRFGGPIGSTSGTDTGKTTLLLGMNPGPWGMAQTGVPFGEVAAVRDWMQLDAPHQGLDPAAVAATDLHPKRPLLGLACPRSEVSGRRLWSLMMDRFGEPDAFFADHFVLNYCPLVFMEASARNLTPDKLPVAERRPLLEACDRHLRRVVQILRPRHVVGVGKFALKQATQALNGLASETPSETARSLRFSSILHPSPASPAANRDWATQATQQLCSAGVWPGL